MFEAFALTYKSDGIPFAANPFEIVAAFSEVYLVGTIRMLFFYGSAQSLIQI